MDETFIDKPLVLIEWHDSNLTEAGWTWVDDEEPPSLAVCKSVGWVVYEDKRLLRLAGSLNQTPDPAQMTCLITIPASAVIQRRTLISSASSPAT